MNLDAQAALEKILHPKSVVVVGANETSGALTAGSVFNLRRHEFNGDIFVVNPNRHSVYGVPTVPTIPDLPYAPETAVIVVRGDLVADSLSQLASLGTKTATVITAGFGEGAAREIGERRSAELRDVLERTGMRILGPNTAGLLNALDSYVPRSAVNHPDTILPGNIAIITQSGGLNNSATNRAWANHVGVGLAVGTGEQFDLTMWDVADYALSDERIAVLLAIVEGFKDADRFLEVARRARDAGKPLVLLKLGVSGPGANMVATHSGALAGSAEVQAAVMSELNVVQVQDVDELWETGSLFSKWGVPADSVNRIGIIAQSGGDAAIAADAAASVGLSMPAPGAAIEEVVKANYPLAQPNNPFDPAGGASAKQANPIGRVVKAFTEDDRFDTILTCTPVFLPDFANRGLKTIVEALRTVNHPRVAMSIWSAAEHTNLARELGWSTGLPVFDGSIRAVRAIRRYDMYGARARRAGHQRPQAAVEQVRADPVPVLSYCQSRTELAAAGIPFNRATLAHTFDDAMAAVLDIGLPVALKASIRAISHKADARAVFPYVRSEQEAAKALEPLLVLLATSGSSAADEGVVVEEYVGATAAAMLGGHRDAEFGPVLVFGLGGGLVEFYREDHAHASCPVDPDYIDELLQTSAFGRYVLAKWPDSPIRDAIVQLSAMFAADERLESFDLNPVLIRADGSLAAVDARVQRRALHADRVPQTGGRRDDIPGRPPAPPKKDLIRDEHEILAGWRGRNRLWCCRPIGRNVGRHDIRHMGRTYRGDQ